MENYRDANTKITWSKSERERIKRLIRSYEFSDNMKIKTLYDTICTIRNRIAHAGFTWNTQDKDKLKQLNKSIWTNKRSEAIKLFQELYNATDSDSRRRSLETNCKYIILNWSAIQAYRTIDGEQVSCSTEGHVSHILSAHLWNFSVMKKGFS